MCTSPIVDVTEVLPGEELNPAKERIQMCVCCVTREQDSQRERWVGQAVMLQLAQELESRLAKLVFSISVLLSISQLCD